MNNASLICITATAGTYLVKTYIYIVIINIYLKINFPQVASSAVRPLTNIPHCCTYLHWGFFRPNVIDQPLSFDYENFKLVKPLPQLLLISIIFVCFLKRRILYTPFYKGFLPYFKVNFIMKYYFTHLYTTFNLKIN
jgi:hypothetical protein